MYKRETSRETPQEIRKRRERIKRNTELFNKQSGRNRMEVIKEEIENDSIIEIEEGPNNENMKQPSIPIEKSVKEGEREETYYKADQLNETLDSGSKQLNATLESASEGINEKIGNKENQRVLLSENKQNRNQEEIKKQTKMPKQE